MPTSAPSVRTELLVTTAILAAAAVLVAALGVVILPVQLDSPAGSLYVGALLAADVGVFVAFGAHQLRRLLTRPLADAVAATEAIAAGDLSRRLPEGATREFRALSASVNRMTDNLLEEQSYRLRAEKLATVGRLAAGIAHEVGNPLGAIDGYAHVLRNRVGAAEGTIREALDGIDRESARIDRIVRGLLDYGRPRRLAPGRLDLNDVLRSTLALLGDQGVLRHLELRSELADEPLILQGERHELEQVFVNVLLNAVDAVDGTGHVAIHSRRVAASRLLEPTARRDDPRAGLPAPRRVSPRVRAWFERAGQLGDVAQVIVADSGSGVAEEDAERIFDPFYTTKEPGKGTGLGLAIVARVVESARGAVWVQRAREGGAAFVLVFPLARGEVTPADGRHVGPAVSASAAPGYGASSGAMSPRAVVGA